MKIVPVRAVELSIGPFCSEIWCERFGDDDVFFDRVNFWAPSHKHRNGHENSPRESCGALDRTILHRMSVRAFSRRRRFWYRGQHLDSFSLKVDLARSRFVKSRSR